MLQALRRAFSLFAHMQDASVGSFEQRRAAYRHNRRQRAGLFACLRRWALACIVALAATCYLDALGRAQDSFGLLVLAAACAAFFSCGVCVLFVGFYAYLHLTHDPGNHKSR